MKEKRFKKQTQIINEVIIIIFLLIIGPNISYGRYYKKILNKYEGTIAEPIIKVQRVSQKIIENNYTKNVQGLEYIFDIYNYCTDDHGNKKVSEIDFSYIITVKETNDNFPVRYELYDITTGEEILQGRLCSNQIKISKGVEYTKRYKLVAIWDDTKELNGSMNDVDIEVEIIQGKKGVLA